MRKVSLAIVVALLAAVAAGSQTTTKVSVLLDWTPNPDHAGLYYAQAKGLFAAAGLDVLIRAPSDPAAPLKLVGAGKTDLAVSYEPELFFAAQQKLPVVAVAAIVPRPLDSLISIDRNVTTVAQLRGRTVGYTGVPTDRAFLSTMLARAGVDPRTVHAVSVGYNLLPVLLAGKVDAILGGYRNVEGIELERRGLKPTILPVDRAGVPSYDELVLVANAKRLRTDPAYARMVERFVGALAKGTAAARRDPAGTLAVLRKVTASDPKLLARQVPATLALLGPVCLSPAAWRAFGGWMTSHGLVKKHVRASTVMTTAALPASCPS